jgi:signal transduction histidine kinase
VLRRQLEWEKFRVERSEELERLRNNFLSIVSHELRTPLVSIKGYTELIRSGRVGEVPERLDEMLKVVERNADRLSTLTDDLLDQQRLESGRLKINPEKIKLQNIIKEVVEEVQPFIIEKNQVLNIQVPDDLAPVRADKNRMTQVLLNLLNNASKFSPPSGSISLQVREISEMVEVQVSDSGIGIAKEDIDKLFKPFPDIQKTDYYKGTGLGLSICKGIIDLHGGRIWAESEGDGRGAKFTFTIPKQSGD